MVDTESMGQDCMRSCLVAGKDHEIHEQLVTRSLAFVWGPSHPIPLFLPPSACNPNACRASGRGLQPKGVRVKEVADFKVFTKGAGSGELKVTVKGPSECQGPGLGDWTVVLTVSDNQHTQPHPEIPDT